MREDDAAQVRDRRKRHAAEHAHVIQRGDDPATAHHDAVRVRGQRVCAPDAIANRGKVANVGFLHVVELLTLLRRLCGRRAPRIILHNLFHLRFHRHVAKAPRDLHIRRHGAHIGRHHRLNVILKPALDSRIGDHE